MNCYQRLFGMVGLLGLLGLWVLPWLAFAHGGEDHGDSGAKAVVAAPAARPRLEASSPEFQVVAILQDRTLLLYLDRYATNEPVLDAKITVESDGQALPAAPGADGAYRVNEAAAWATPGTHEVIVTVEADGTSDILIGNLVMPPSPIAAPAPASRAGWEWVEWLGAGAIGLLLGLLLGRRDSTTAAALGLSLLLGLSLPSPRVLAHGGEDHSVDKPAVILPTSNETAQRLPDGSLFVPKPVQRVLGLRTTLARVQEMPRTVELNGHLVADPNKSGRVQATQAGRIAPTSDGLPYLGQAVKADQVLAYVLPVAASIEIASQQALLAELDSQIDLATRRLNRLQQLVGSVAAKDIEEARTELSGLRQRRAAVGGGLSGREPLRAPVEGIVSVTILSAGQVVEARQILVEIINPAAWWVEALTFDPALVNQIDAAVAQTLEGRALPLRFLGMGFQRRSQGLPMQFQVVGEGKGLSAGQPVRILVQTRERLAGVALPRDAITRAGGGEPQVWVQATAERFVAQPVRVQAVDGTTVVAFAGLRVGERVVTIGASLLAQVR